MYYIVSRKKLDILKLDAKFIRIACKLFSPPSAGPKEKNDKRHSKFHRLFCKLLGNNYKISFVNLSYILKREYETLETMYSNNIKMNFNKYLNKYVNNSFNVPKINRLTKGEYMKFDKIQRNEYKIKKADQFKQRKEMLSKVKPIKDDLLNDTNNSPAEYVR